MGYLSSFIPCGKNKGHRHSLTLKTNAMILYKIKLPAGQDADAFVRFMQEEYFPAVEKGPTRIGAVTGLTLLQSRAADDSHEFYLLAGWSGLPDRDIQATEAATKKLAGFKAKLKRVGDYREAAAWTGKKK